MLIHDKNFNEFMSYTHLPASRKKHESISWEGVPQEQPLDQKHFLMQLNF